MSEQFLTRRQLRDLERSGQPLPPRAEARPEMTATSALKLPPEVLNPVLNLSAPLAGDFMTRRKLREQELETVDGSESEAISFSQPNFGVESQPASLVVDQVNDIVNMTQVLDSGEILQTGSITLPILSTATGELALVADTAAADAAVAADAGIGYVSSISPVRASEVRNFGAKIGIVPGKNRPGESQLYLALTISVSLVAVGALILGGYMLNLFN